MTSCKAISTKHLPRKHSIIGIPKMIRSQRRLQHVRVTPRLSPVQDWADGEAGVRRTTRSLFLLIILQLEERTFLVISLVEWTLLIVSWGGGDVRTAGSWDYVYFDVTVVLGWDGRVHDGFSSFRVWNRSYVVKLEGSRIELLGESYRHRTYFCRQALMQQG